MAFDFLDHCRLSRLRLNVSRTPDRIKIGMDSTRGPTEPLKWLQDAPERLRKVQFNCIHQSSPLGGTKMMPLFSLFLMARIILQ